MKEYWIDFSGWFKVTAETKEKAHDEAFCQLSNKLQNLNEIYIEINSVEEDN